MHTKNQSEIYGFLFILKLFSFQLIRKLKKKNQIIIGIFMIIMLAYLSFVFLLRITICNQFVAADGSGSGVYLSK